MCDGIANGYPRAPNLVIPPCPPANVIIASNVLNTDGNVIAGNIISVDGTFTGNLYVSGTVVSNISYSALNVTGTINASTFSGQAFYGNGYALSNLNASNLTGTIQSTNLPAVGAVGTYGDFSNVSQLTIDQYGRVTAAGNVAILSSQWTSVAGNVAYQNGVSIGTLSAPPPGSNLLVLGTANITTLNVTTLFANSATVFGSQTLNVLGVSNLAYVVGDGGGLANLMAGALVGTVNFSNTAGVVTNPAQTNITSLGTLSSLGVSGGVTGGTFYGSGSGLSGVPVANLVGTVNFSNVAGSVTVASQPNITSVGTLSALAVSGGVTAGTFYGSGSGLTNVPVANLSGTVNYANTAGVVTNPAQANITSLGTLTSLVISGSFSAQGNAVTNVQSAVVVTANAQPNITSVGTLSSLQVTGSVTGGTFYGSGSGLTNVPVGNLIGTVNYANTAGAVVNPAQPNITSLGSLTTLLVIGTLQGGTIIGDGQGLYGIHSSAIIETVATANSVVQPAQTNITSLGTLTGLNVQGLLVASNASGLSNINAANVTLGTLSTSVFPASGVGAGTYGSGANVSQVSIDAYGRVTLASNVPIVASQWTSVAGNVAYQNGVSIGTLSAPPVGSNLYVLGTTTLGNVTANGSALSALQASNIQGNVAQANVALVVSQPAQPNITSLGTLTGLTINGLLSASNGSGIANLTAASITGNVAQSNVALVVSQPAQPNITSLGTLTGLVINGLLSVSNGSEIANLTAASITGNVAQANVALVVSQPAQPNITSVNQAGKAFTVNGLLVASNASGLSNINASNLVGNVAQANVALVVSQPAQPNITSVGTLTGLVINGLLSASNGSGIANLTAASITGNVAQANVALIVSQNAQPNITSLGTLTGLVINGLLSVSNGSGIANLTAASITGNVAQANVALIVSQPAQPNITSLGTLTGLAVSGLLSASNGSGIANLTAASITGNVAQANVALVVSQNAQPNITSLGTLTGLVINGLLSVSNGSGIANLTAASITGNVAQANVALIVSQPAQPNITSLGTLTGLVINGLLSVSNGSGIANLTAASITGNVAQANVALVVSQPVQPNITSLGTLTGLAVSGLLSAGLYTGNASGLSNINGSNVSTVPTALSVTQANQSNITQVGTLTGLYSVGNVTATFFSGQGNALTNVLSSILVGNVAQANVALVVSQNAQPNITSLGTLTGLVINGLLSASNGSGIANLTAASITGNVAQANVALVVSQNAQPNITSLGTLTGLVINGLLSASNGSGIANLTAASITGNVAQSNIALIVSQPAQPNITSLGTLTGLVINGLVSASNGSGIANLTAASITGNVAQANVALVVSQNAQPNITSLGTLTGLVINGLLSVSNGSGIANLTAASITGNVAQANVALIVSQPAQPNITSVGVLSSLNVSGTSNLGVVWGSLATQTQTNITSVGLLSNLTVSNTVTTGNLTVTSNILPGAPTGNTYLTGNLVVSGNVFSALGVPLGSGGGYYFSLPGDIALQTPYTGAVYGVTYPLSVGLSNGFTISGTSTLITVTPNGNFKFGVAGPYLLRAVFNSTDNIKGLAVGSNVADVHGTDQGYMYRYTTFITQNPTELIEIPFNVTDVSKYYYLDLFSVDGGSLHQTANTSGGTYLTITPLQGGGLASGGPGGTPGTQWISSGSNIYYSNSVGIGAINPQYNLDVVGNVHANSFVSDVVTGRTTAYTATPSDHYIGLSSGRSVTLPVGSSCPVGKTFIIKDESSNASINNISLFTTGGDLIDGQSIVTLALNNISLTALWTGTRWSLI